VNIAIMIFLRAQGAIARYPAMLGMGASAGLMAGFLALFALIHLRRRAVHVEPARVEVG
jgi:hypothetical protein